ncbi:kielin/chordin-like protein [Homalodisca vitripennis]|uniref:kielin/chordin-like protein n=1 Tax=Homalodisca vitripennis TaxID=197043 RepID=UPI001EEB2799|nr:kielin/chordin-like protein [Homalodisca vitripennis]
MSIVVALLLVVHALSIQGSNPCNNVAHTFYRKLKCTPEMTPGSSCPASYKCDYLLNRDKEMCYLFGREYAIDSVVSRNKVDFETPCIESCTCIKSDEGAKFWCQLGRGLSECEPLPQECRRHVFEESFSCCKKSFVTCDKVSDPTHRKDVKCIYNNKTYSEGERFFPTSDVTCTQCICADGFNGSIASPFCAPTDCPLELWGDTPHRLTQGCIPVYLSAQGCCPVMFRCPNSTDSIVKAEKTPSDREELTCNFGHLKMNVGDKISPWADHSDVECRCDIPPMPICTKTNMVLTADMIRMINHDHRQ